MKGEQGGGGRGDPSGDGSPGLAPATLRQGIGRTNSRGTRRISCRGEARRGLHGAPMRIGPESLKLFATIWAVGYDSGDAEHRFSTERLRWQLRTFLPCWVRFHAHHRGLHGWRVFARPAAGDVAAILASRGGGRVWGGGRRPPSRAHAGRVFARPAAGGVAAILASRDAGRVRGVALLPLQSSKAGGGRLSTHSRSALWGALLASNLSLRPRAPWRRV